MEKKKQILETSQWLDELYESCMVVIEQTDMSSIGPFELVNLVNTRLFLEKLSREDAVKKTNLNIGKPSLFVISSGGKGSDDKN